MNRPLDQRISILVVPITWVVAAIVAIILGVCKQDWIYYLIGIFTGLLNFGLMLKFNRRFVRMAELDPNHASIVAKKQAWFGLLLRLLVFLGVFIAIYFKRAYGNPNGIWSLAIAFGGYATVKFVLIVVYLIFRRKVSE